VVREGYAKAAAAAGVKTLFCRGFGRGFFIYIVYSVLGCGRSKLQHLIRFVTNKYAVSSLFPAKRPGTQLAITVGYISTMYPPQRTRKRGDK
jgi:hypothetical protein